MTERLKNILMVVLAIGFILVLLENSGFINTRHKVRIYDPDELPVEAEEDEVSTPIPQIEPYGALKSGE